MDDRAALRAEILAEIGPVLTDTFAAAEWGRLLVQVVRADDGITWRVASMDVEDVVGSDERIEAAMGSQEARLMLPAIAEAVDALSSTFEVDVDDVEGGTFLRLAAGGFAFLPGLVRTPSESFERLRDAAFERARARLDALPAVTRATRYEMDLPGGKARFFRGERVSAVADVTLLSSFAAKARTWVWAWANPSLDEAVKAPSRELCDAVPQRDMWEISTPQFFTDERTAFELAAVVAQTADGDVYPVDRPDGRIFVVLRDVRLLDG